jgi:hypothetical protein
LLLEGYVSLFGEYHAELEITFLGLLGGRCFETTTVVALVAGVEVAARAFHMLEQRLLSYCASGSVRVNKAIVANFCEILQLRTGISADSRRKPHPFSKSSPQENSRKLLSIIDQRSFRISADSRRKPHPLSKSSPQENSRKLLSFIDQRSFPPGSL